MGTIKGRNSKDLTEAEETKKRWQEYREKLYKKDLTDPGIKPGSPTLQADALPSEPPEGSVKSTNFQ